MPASPNTKLALCIVLFCTSLGYVRYVYVRMHPPMPPPIPAAQEQMAQQAETIDMVFEEEIKSLELTSTDLEQLRDLLQQRQQSKTREERQAINKQIRSLLDDQQMAQLKQYQQERQGRLKQLAQARQERLARMAGSPADLQKHKADMAQVKALRTQRKAQQQPVASAPQTVQEERP